MKSAARTYQGSCRFIVTVRNYIVGETLAEHDLDRAVYERQTVVHAASKRSARARLDIIPEQRREITT